jgi:hypothetical protein
MMTLKCVRHQEPNAKLPRSSSLTINFLSAHDCPHWIDSDLPYGCQQGIPVKFIIAGISNVMIPTQEDQKALAETIGAKTHTLR